MLNTPDRQEPNRILRDLLESNIFLYYTIFHGLMVYAMGIRIKLLGQTVSSTRSFFLRQHQKK